MRDMLCWSVSPEIMMRLVVLFSKVMRVCLKDNEHSFQFELNTIYFMQGNRFPADRHPVIGMALGMTQVITLPSRCSPEHGARIPWDNVLRPGGSTQREGRRPKGEALLH
jgi:hypothetical protein